MHCLSITGVMVLQSNRLIVGMASEPPASDNISRRTSASRHMQNEYWSMDMFIGPLFCMNVERMAGGQGVRDINK